MNAAEVICCGVCRNSIGDGDRSWTKSDGEKTTTLCDPCRKAADVAGYLTTMTITTRLMMDSQSCHFHLVECGGDSLHRLRQDCVLSWQYLRGPLLQIDSECKVLHAIAERFVAECWLPRMRDQFEAAGWCPMEQVFPDLGLKVDSWSSGGRVLITLGDVGPADTEGSKFGGAQLTVICSDSPTLAGGGGALQHIAATFLEARALFKAAMGVKEFQFKQPIYKDDDESE